jgi:hypothetical protein
VFNPFLLFLLIIKNKNKMEETKGLDTGISCDPNCPECAKRKAEMEMAEDMNFAILIALVPAMAFTLINFTGLV